MKLIRILFGILILTNVASAQFVETFRSQSGRRPARAIELLDGGDLSSRVKDLNGNGSNDYQTISNALFLFVTDGRTKQNIVSGPLPVPPGSSISVNFFKFFDNGNSPFRATHGIAEVETAVPAIMAINLETWEVDWQMQDARIIAVDDVDGDGFPDVMVFDRANRQIVMVSWGGSSSGAGGNETTEPLFKRSQDYQLVKKFESEPGTRLAIDQSLLMSTQDFDYNGDGVMEIVLLEEDENGNAIGVRVRNGATRELKWSLRFPESGPVLEDIRRGFLGFFDANGDGEPEAVFGKRTVVTLDKTIHTLDPNFETLAVYDLDGDEAPELIGRGVQDSTVQVWGSPNTPTGISDRDLAVAGFQLQQNYPNPFNPSTTIRYSLENPGRIEMTIFDTLGRQVRALINEHKPAGEYAIAWDGRNDAGMRVTSGAYFYQIKAGGRQQTRRMILLK